MVEEVSSCRILVTKEWLANRNIYIGGKNIFFKRALLLTREHLLSYLTFRFF